MSYASWRLASWPRRNRATRSRPRAEDLARTEKASDSFLKGNHAFWALTASAGLHYRAAQYQQAVELLQQCLNKYPTWDGKVLDWLWLAMAYHRLGKESDARQWLDKATQWFETCSTRMPEETSDGISWHLHDWLEAQVLRREAEALIAGKKDAPKK